MKKEDMKSFRIAQELLNILRNDRLGKTPDIIYDRAVIATAANILIENSKALEKMTEAED